MVRKGTKPADPFGQMLLDQLRTGQNLCEIMEREDGFIATASMQGHYFSPFRTWSAVEKKAVSLVRGHVLDIGCGAGRHSLHYQEKGLTVTAIDVSPGAVKVSRARGVKNVLLRPIDKISLFKPETFDSVIMMGNNFGLFGGARRAKKILDDLDRITTARALIVAGSLNPYGTKDPSHLRYHRFNKQRGRMGGQIKTRVRFRDLVGEWFDYLLASPAEMETLLDGTVWRLKTILGDPTGNYFGIIEKAQLTTKGLASTSGSQTRRRARA